MLIVTMLECSEWAHLAAVCMAAAVEAVGGAVATLMMSVVEEVPATLLLLVVYN